MKTTLALAASGLILVCCAIATLAKPVFKPPEITFATDVQYPISAVETGIVVVDVSLSREGEVIGTTVPRDVPSLTPIATESVQNWKYMAASLSGVSCPSTIRIAFVFRPHALFAAPPNFSPLKGQLEAASGPESGFAPPDVLSAVYPSYPIDAASVGAVVLQAKLARDGNIRGLKVIRPFPPFTRFSVDAAKKWQFGPAKLAGEPVPSDIVLAFVYSTPASAR